MNFERQYINQLEQLILEKLLPIYSKYYKITGQTEPELDELRPLKAKKQVPALLKKKA